MIPLSVSAQSRHADVWNFGEKCRIKFETDGTITATVDPVIDTFEGTSSFSDPTTGELIMYTDGQRVWQADGTEVANDLPGHPSSMHSGIIVPRPLSAGRVFVLGHTNVTSTSVGYREFDVSDPTNIIPIGANISVPTPNGQEAMVVVQHDNGLDYWVIVSGNNEVYVIPFTVAGFGVPVTVPTGVFVQGFNVFAISNGGGKLVTSNRDGGDVFSFDFNTATGALTNKTTLFPLADNQKYGGAFSPDDTKLYFSSIGSGGQPSQLYQYDFNTGVNSLIDAQPVRYKHSQTKLGPDGKMYISTGTAAGSPTDEGPFLSVITNPNADFADLDFSFASVPLAMGCNPELGLPQTVALTQSVPFGVGVNSPNGIYAGDSAFPTGTANLPDGAMLTITMTDGAGFSETCMATVMSGEWTCATPITGIVPGTYDVEATDGTNSGDSTFIQTCGNGTIEGGESCDDTNFINGDNCNASCQIEDDDGDGIYDSEECSDATFANCENTDGDSLPDYQDLDSDNDGIPDELECTGSPCEDTDNDFIPDYLDLDSDNDGISDAAESGAGDTNGDGIVDGFVDVNMDGQHDPVGMNGIDPTDSDNDGEFDFQSVDADGDGLPDATEGHDADVDGTPDVIPANNDTDMDGIDDAFDPDCAAAGDCLNDVIGVIAPQPNFDGDAFPDFQDADADGDGIADWDECSNPGSCENTDGSDGPDYLDRDSDDDGVLDSIEGTDVDLDGVADVTPVGNDTDGDGIDDAFDHECISMGDCLNDVIGAPPALPNTDGSDGPNFQDTDDDNDGIPTPEEIADGITYGDDPDNDGIPAYLDTDSDGDGVNDIAEYGFDIDNDGIPDYLDPDSAPMDADNDGIPDSVECGGPITNGCPDTDDDGVLDYLDDDDDNDGIATLQELMDDQADDNDEDTDSFSSHLDVDADGDGILDSVECTMVPCEDTDEDGTPDYLDIDSDNDGLSDNAEGFDADFDGVADVDVVDASDTDMDGLIDAYDTDDGGIAAPTPDSDEDGTPNFQDSDDDGDGLDTLDEDIDDDGNPVNDDTDGDGVPNSLDPDDDGDGVPSADEDVDADNDLTNDDTDGDGVPNFLDPDDDGDGVPTLEEDLDKDGDPTNDDTDEDDVPNYLDPDDDGDGINTIDEDPNKDGNPANDDSDGDGTPDYLDPAGSIDNNSGDILVVGGPGCSSMSSNPSPGLWFLMIGFAAMLVRRRRR